jgi:tRNA-splicing ligase RtcB
MDIALLKQLDEYAWQVEPHGRMCVPAIFYASEELVRQMDDKVYEQACNVATLPGIVTASYAMPDAHWGYGFPIGGVAAFDAEKGGIISAGGVGFDISCGVRTLHTGLGKADIEADMEALAESLYYQIPAGLGSTGNIRLDHREMDDMLVGGAQWAVEQGWGRTEDLEHIEEHGCMADARPEMVSDFAKKRQYREMGTLGSGNHYLEVQHIAEIYNERIALAFGIREGDIMLSIHCGSRGLGHQIGTEFLKRMAKTAKENGIRLPDRELACAPIKSAVGQSYLGAMRAGINCALANRQILTHLAREAFAAILPQADLRLLYDVSHNTCKEEEHMVNKQKRTLFVHRKGATRALGPNNPLLPATYRSVGQPVLIGGTMGTSSYILAGGQRSEERSFGSACHGAGRAMSRRAATRQWQGRNVIKQLKDCGIIVRSPSMRGIAEEAPGAYKDVNEVVDSANAAGLATKVARLEPMICIKG